MPRSKQALHDSLMRPWRLRESHHDDFDQAISIWDQNRLPGDPQPAFGMSEVATGAQTPVVAVVGDQLIGVAGGLVAANARGSR